MTSSGANNGWEPFFWLVFKRSGVPMRIVDDGGITLTVNDAMCDYLGRSRTELVGRPADADVAPSSRKAYENGWQRLRRTGDLVTTVDMVRADGTTLRSEFAARSTVIKGKRLYLCVLVAGEPTPENKSRQAGALTPRERSVVHLLTLGMTSQQIAKRLSVTTETVRTHVRNAMAKTSAKTRAQLVAIALAERHTSRADMPPEAADGEASAAQHDRAEEAPRGGSPAG